MNQILTAVLIFISFLHAQRISVIPEEIQMETTWYVSPTGSDESGDGSEGNPFGTIQHGIDFSQSGDEVIVLPGTYFEGINFYGKEITVGSLFHITGDTTYIQETIIDGNNESCPVVFVNGESRNSKLTGLTIQNGDGCTFGNGGGIYLEDSSPTLDHLVIQENFGLTGGGVFVNVGGNPLLKNSVIRNNTCFSEGCGVAVYNAEIEIENCTVTSNMFTIDYSLGGGVSFYNSEGSVINTVITQNSAESGGGISCYNSNPTIEGTIISNNVAIYGGGINCRENSSPALLNVSILENTATQGGGLRCRDNSNPAVQNSTILGNSAAQYGGGIYTNNADPNINHSLIVQNSAGEGGGVYGRINSDITLQNVTISDNSATEGGGLYLRNNSSSLMEHSIFWNDTPQEIFLHPSETANQITVSNSDVQGGEDGIVTNDNGTIYWYDGNIDSDPLFCDPENGDYTVAANSPCQLWDANIGALGIGCDAVWSFTLDYLEIQDENNNEMWEPGETLTLSVTLCNVGTADHFFYPGVV
ncbi:MAG: right-handed parallel beta-helix repeat-containing protein, partial [Candidatus Marinimicrobia bacterium]|nr:right-handed parallel beta-helix repeat-containing protein [Candidatus Neomarinimicrobiota bacterium]